MKKWMIFFFMVVFFGIFGFFEYRKRGIVTEKTPIALHMQAKLVTIASKGGMAYCSKDNKLVKGQIEGSITKIFGYFFDEDVRSKKPRLEGIGKASFATNTSENVLCVKEKGLEINQVYDWWVLTINELPKGEYLPKKGILYLTGRPSSKAVNAFGHEHNIPVYDSHEWSDWTYKNGEITGTKRLETN